MALRFANDCIRFSLRVILLAFSCSFSVSKRKVTKMSTLLPFLTMSRPKMQAQDSRLQFFIVSLLSIIALRYAGSLYFSTPAAVISNVCQTRDQPNPIASLYPNNATGTLNGSVAVLPISLQLARQLIPPQYVILEHAYRRLLPDFPLGMYPAVLQAVHDHEVQAFGYKIADFSVGLTSMFG